MCAITGGVKVETEAAWRIRKVNQRRRVSGWRREENTKMIGLTVVTHVVDIPAHQMWELSSQTSNQLRPSNVPSLRVVATSVRKDSRLVELC